MDLLAQGVIKIKFDENTVFEIPIEPTVDTVIKMDSYQNKIQDVSVNEGRILLSEIVELILSQDKKQENINKIISCFYPSQLLYVFNFYGSQRDRNQKSKQLIAPFDVTQIGKQSNSNNQEASYFDVLGDVTYLSRKMSISPYEIWQLPHSHYLGYLKWNITFDYQESEEGREILDKFNRYMNPRTDADLGSIRTFAGYGTKEVGD